MRKLTNKLSQRSVRTSRQRGREMPPRKYKLVDNDFEAMQVTAETADEIEEWTGGRRVEEIDAIDDTRRFVAVNIPTQRGPARASQGDYVIKHSDGSLEKVSERKFHERFEMRECDG